MKKALVLCLLTFFGGFLTHAFVFPDFLANGIVDVQQIALPNPTPTGAQTQQAFETYITYDGRSFNRHNVTIEVGSYLIITNTNSTKQMWLLSNNPLLETIRGYGESEQVREKIEEKGQFVVTDKNNPSERLVITVK